MEALLKPAYVKREPTLALWCLSFSQSVNLANARHLCSLVPPISHRVTRISRNFMSGVIGRTKDSGKDSRLPLGSQEFPSLHSGFPPAPGTFALVFFAIS